MNSPSPLVSVVIPNYNGADFLPALIESLRRQSFSEFEVIIVDDCSPCPRTSEFLKQLAAKDDPTITVVRNARNIGYVKNCNSGIRLARGRFICLLNNDTVLAENFIARNLAVFAANPGLGVLSCTIVDEHNQIWFSGGRFKNGRIENLQDEFSGIREVEWVPGTALFVRREVYETAGLFNETFGMYHEDVEFCTRARRRTNFQIAMFSDKLVTHYLGRPQVSEAIAKQSRLYYYRTRNQLLLARMYAPEAFRPALKKGLAECGVVLREKLPLRPRFIAQRLYSLFLVLAGIVSGATAKIGSEPEQLRPAD